MTLIGAAKEHAMQVSDYPRILNACIINYS